MVNKNKIKEDSEVIKTFLEKEEMSLSDLVRKTDLSRGQIRISVAYLLGARKIKERNIGMAKVYTLK